jgi:hypothetical protein
MTLVDKMHRCQDLMPLFIKCIYPTRHHGANEDNSNFSSKLENHKGTLAAMWQPRGVMLKPVPC